MTSPAEYDETPLPAISAGWTGLLEGLKAASEDVPVAGPIFTAMDLSFNVATTGVDAAATGKYLGAFESAVAATAAAEWASGYLKGIGWGAVGRGFGTGLVAYIGTLLISQEVSYLDANAGNIITYFTQLGDSNQTIAQAITSSFKGAVTNAYNSVQTRLGNALSEFNEGVINTAVGITAFDQDTSSLATQIDGDVVQDLDNAVTALGGATSSVISAFESQAATALTQGTTSFINFIDQAVSVIGNESSDNSDPNLEALALDTYIDDNSDTLPSDVASALETETESENGQALSLADGSTVTENPDGSYSVVLPDPAPGDGISQTTDLFDADGIPISELVSYANNTTLLTIDNPATYTSVIPNFVEGDTIDLTGIGTATEATLGDNNVLTVEEADGTDITLNLDPSQSFAGEGFGVAADGNGGTNVTLGPETIAPAVAAETSEASGDTFDAQSSPVFTAGSTLPITWTGAVTSSYSIPTGDWTAYAGNMEYLISGFSGNTEFTDQTLAALGAPASYTTLAITGPSYASVTSANGISASDTISYDFSAPVPPGASFLLWAPGGSFSYEQNGQITSEDTGPFTFTVSAELDGASVSTAGWAIDVETPSGNPPVWSYSVGSGGQITINTVITSTPFPDAVIVITPDAPVDEIQVTADTLSYDTWGFAVPTSLACFAAGVPIRTTRGDTAVEQLRVGDHVQTVLGRSPTPIKWIGHRHIDCRRHPTPESVWPIRIAPHAFAENAPHRPLYLSPEHAVFTDGVLIPIRHLVNGATIAQEPRDEVTYYHIELPHHDVILAEGLPCESWLDTGNRSMFENAAITDLHPSFAATAAQAWAHDACAPLVETGPVLEAIRARLNARAGLPTDPTAHQSGPLHGWIDGATSETIHGWAWQPEHPGHGARLEILAGDTLLGEVLANEPRPDVRDAGRLEILRDGVVTGHDDGRCGFTFRLPTPLSPFTPHTIRVRRAADGAELWNSGQITLQPAARLDPAALAGFATALRAAAATGTEAERTALTSFIAHQADHLLTLSETATPDPRPLALFIDETLPAPEQNAAAQAALDHMRSLQTLGYHVAFAAADPTEGDPTPLQTLGITIPAVPSVEDALRRLGPQTALVYLHRIATASRYTELVRHHCPNARLVYSVADLHFLRVARQAAHTGSAALAAESRRLRARELHAASLADRVITHSPAEAALLRTHAPGARVHVVPWSVPLRPTARPFQDRNGIAFIGGYRHAPNVDAAHWLINTIMPLVRQQDPSIECLLVGSHLPDDLSRITHGGIVPIGHAPDLAAIFDRVRLTVAPLRYGAGLKGKLLHSLAAGVPCIATPVAAEGLPLLPALQGCIGATEAELAALILRLHTDERRNTAAAEAGLQMIREGFSTDQVDRRMRDAVGHAPMPAMQAARCHPAAPGHPAAAVA